MSLMCVRGDTAVRVGCPKRRKRLRKVDEAHVYVARFVGRDAGNSRAWLSETGHTEEPMRMNGRHRDICRGAGLSSLRFAASQRD
jgi:hypothetical protein